MEEGEEVELVADLRIPLTAPHVHPGRFVFAGRVHLGFDLDDLVRRGDGLSASTIVGGQQLPALGLHGCTGRIGDLGERCGLVDLDRRVHHFGVEQVLTLTDDRERFGRLPRR